VSNHVSNWVWDHSTASGNDLIILLKIADNANADGGGAYPGIDYLARAARISKRAVYDCLRRLKAAGELAEEAGGGGRGRKTTYRVLMDVKAKGAEPAPNPETENGAAPRVETVQPAALNGADSGSAYKEEPPLNPPENLDPPTPQAPTLVLVAQARPVDEPLALFEHWQTSTGQQRATFSAKRRTLAVKAIESYGLDYCLKAAEGWRHSPFHRGENDRGTIYNRFGLIFRDDEHIEQFHNFAEGSAIARPTKHGMTDWRAVGDRWAAQQDAKEPPAIGGLE
jgi:hypothetical protein